MSDEWTEKSVPVMPEHLEAAKAARAAAEAETPEQLQEALDGPDVHMAVGAPKLDGEGWLEPPIMGEVVRPAIDGAAEAAVKAGLLHGQLAGLVFAAREELVEAAAESCERNSYVAQALFNRWQERLWAAGKDELLEELKAAKDDLLPFLELVAALQRVLWGFVQVRRLHAKWREDAERRRQAQAARGVRFEDVEPELQRILGARYRAPTTPERRERLVQFIQRWHKAKTDKQRAKALEWLEAH